MTVPRQSRPGFTLIEVMLAMAIGTAVILLAISMLGRGQEDYERIGGGVGAEREARAVLTQLTADLQSARFHEDLVFETSTAAWPKDRLGILSLQAAEAQSTAGQLGDLCAVHYYLKDLLIEGKAVRCLMRGFRDSNETFTALHQAEAAALFSPAERDEPIAFGVIAFSARPKTRDAEGAWQDWVKSPTVPPDALDLRLVIARRELAARLTTSAAWDGGGTGAQAFTSRYLETYSTLVRFGNRPPPPQAAPPAN
jgi:prepilin-type N-terminal cleavage/methylation domain-containing protein